MNTSRPGVARLSWLSSAWEGAEKTGKDILFLRPADLLEPALLSAGENAALRAALRRGRVQLLPLSPTPSIWEEELILRELFAGERLGEMYGTRPCAPYLTGGTATPLAEMLAHFGHEVVFVLAENTDAPKSTAYPTPDGAVLDVYTLPSQADKCGVETFFLPSARRASSKGRAAESSLPVSAEQSASHALAPVFPCTYEQGELCAAKRTLSQLLFCRFEPLCAALSLAGVRIGTRRALTDAVLSAMTYPTTHGLAAAEIELAHGAAEYLHAAGKGFFDTEKLPATTGTPLGVLTVFYPYTRAAERTVTAEITLPGAVSHTAACPTITLLSEDGRLIPADIHASVITKEGNTSYTICFATGRLAPLSFARYLVLSEQTGAPKKQKVALPVLENKHYRLAFSEGELSLTVKATGQVLQSPFFLEEQGSRQQGAFSPTAEGSLLAFPEPACRIRGTHTPVMELSFLMDVPVSYDFEADERALATEPLSVTLTLSFAGDEGELLSLGYAVKDPAAHHRLRLALRSGCMGESVLCASGRHFASVEGGALPAAEIYAHADANAHFAAYLYGERGAEWVNDTLYLTLLEADCAIGGSQSGKFSLSFGKPVSFATLRARADSIAAKPFASFCPMGEIQKSGTPCVPNSLAGLAYDGNGVVLSAVKPAEDGDGVILRFASLAHEEAYLSLHADGVVCLTTLKEEGELPLDGADVRLRLAPFQSLTLRLRPDVREALEK